MAEQVGLYRYSGKMDKTVGSRWRKSRDLVKFWKGPAKGREIPLTMKQQIARMSELGRLSGIFYPVYQMGMAKFAKRSQMSVNNLFTKVNMPAVSVNSSLVPAVTYSQVLVAKGHLPQVLFSQADFSTPQTVKISFGAASGVWGASDDDKVYGVVYCPTVGGIVISRPATRDAGRIDITLPDDWNGLRIEVWGFGVGGDETNRNYGECCDSTFLGEGTVN